MRFPLLTLVMCTALGTSRPLLVAGCWCGSFMLYLHGCSTPLEFVFGGWKPPRNPGIPAPGEYPLSFACAMPDLK